MKRFDPRMLSVKCHNNLKTSTEESNWNALTLKQDLCKCIASCSEINVFISRLPTFFSSLIVIPCYAWL